MSATEQGMNTKWVHEIVSVGPFRIEQMRRVAEPDPVEDVHVLECMAKYGSGFIKALAEAGYRADSVNLAKLKAAWPDLWAEYSAWARAARRKPEGQP